MKTIDDFCTYATTGLSGSGTGCVHLVMKVYWKKGRTEREAGQFLCSKSYGERIRTSRPATRAEFVFEPCPRCLAQAEKMEIDVGSLWADLPGPWVSLYTTSPEKRDRPYFRGGKVVGEYLGQEVRLVQVPQEFLEWSRRWCQRDQYFAFDENDWNMFR